MRDGVDEDPTDAPLDTHRQTARVRAVYDEIASHFSKTRAYPWPEIETFLASVSADEPGTVGLDIGCGNGRHTDPLAAETERVVAVDLSRALLAEARERLSNGDSTGARPGTDERVVLVQADAAAVPLAAGVADVALYIATVHHLPDRERRVRSLSELARVLAPGGRALVSAWSTTHDRFDASAGGFDTTVDWTLPGGETVPRFYHIYAPDEFERDLRAAGLVVESATVSSGNCYAEVRPGD
ncbi:MAG: methylase involved in ubiquinone/menaquinone biosynthesis [halophilic archaeon J07HX64]|jgi:Methylase involved in ubiquinone/menaquinone biosynthesis|nr:MAG: methylase involved in ubiquinone/menaquinone biosynthesis [halophilic archaeon J07HX64]